MRISSISLFPPKKIKRRNIEDFREIVNPEGWGDNTYRNIFCLRLIYLNQIMGRLNLNFTYENFFTK
jgi:hypothetical protein